MPQQYFCGEQYFQHTPPIDPSQMTRFRARIGEAGCEFMLGLTLKAGIATKTVAVASLAVINVWRGSKNWTPWIGEMKLKSNLISF